MWYLDDGHLVGKTPQLLKCLDLIHNFGPSLGLHLNLSKCVAFGQQKDSFPREIIRASDGLLVLGAPMGSDNFVTLKVSGIVDKASSLMRKTKEIEDPQMELLLLRCCTGSAKLIYWLRNCVPEVIKDQILLFDNAIDQSLQHILGVPIHDQDRLKIHLPLSMGGLGIAKASLVANAAFVSSVASSWMLQPNSSPRKGFQEACNIITSSGMTTPTLPNKSSSSIVSPSSFQTKEFAQNKFMLSINSDIRQKSISNADMRQAIIFNGRTCKGSNYWLTSPPDLRSRSIIDAAPFRLLLKYSIGMPLFDGPLKCPDCGSLQDKFGHHALSCRVGSVAIDKHNSIVRAIFSHMKQAKISCSMEAFNPMSDSRQRPGDIHMSDFDNFGDAFFDVSVINICADSYVTRAAKGVLEGSSIRYDAKMKKYPDLGPRFKPLVLESTGGWHKLSFNYLRTLADHIASRTNKLASEALNSLLCATSFCLQRHQGTMLVRRCLGLS
jgi:hypothetical protein